MAKVFDTYETSTALDKLITGDLIPEGHIVAAACKDDCTTNISFAAMNWFTEMGSREFTNLHYRDGFAFIG